MKALTVHQPWATLLVTGAKSIETRGWHTRHRGPLLIHAAKTNPAYARQWMDANPWVADLLPDGDLPRGVILGLVEVESCIPVETLLPRISEQEQALGNYTTGAGRFGWVTTQPYQYTEPVAINGKQGLWTYEGPRLR